MKIMFSTYPVIQSRAPPSEQEENVKANQENYITAKIGKVDRGY